MSRGAGNIQRRILAFLDSDPGPHSTFRITGAVYDVQPDKDGIPWLETSQLSSVRRALGQLAKSGAIQGNWRAGWGQLHRRAGHTRQLWATPAQWKALTKEPCDHHEVKVSTFLFYNFNLRSVGETAK